MAQILSYAGKQVQEADKPRFFLSLKAPPKQRAALWALYAFNIEISKTREVVTETTIGLMRLQWWRDAIDAVYNEKQAPHHYIMDDLKAAILDYHLPQEHFDKLIYAREFDLENVLPASMEGLRNYADYTTAPLTHLSLKVLGQDENERHIRDISIGYAITGLLRSIPFHAGQDRFYLPEDMVNAHSITLKEIFKPAEREKLCDLVSEVVEGIQQMLKASAPSHRHLKIVKKMAKSHIKRLRHKDYNVFDAAVQRNDPFFYLKLWLK